VITFHKIISVITGDYSQMKWTWLFKAKDPLSSTKLHLNSALNWSNLKKFQFSQNVYFYTIHISPHITQGTTFGQKCQKETFSCQTQFAKTTLALQIEVVLRQHTKHQRLAQRHQHQQYGDGCRVRGLWHVWGDLKHHWLGHPRSAGFPLASPISNPGISQRGLGNHQKPSKSVRTGLECGCHYYICCHSHGQS